MTKEGDPGLANAVLGGDPRALARALSLVEDRRPGHLELLSALYRRAGKARTLGITGPPGAGKSTLVDRLIRHYRGKGLRVGVVAVDPSSAFSGGAILGDRIRMQDWSTDEGVFIRSMATRGHMGGLAAATGDALTVLDAAGYDILLVETVGVGQDEVDVVREADAVLVILVPGLGDDVQAMKAGVMEIADIFVINKADREGADRVERELSQLMALAPEEAPRPEVVKTVATTGAGVDELAEAVARVAAHSHDTPAKHRRKFFDVLSERFLTRLCETWLDGDRLPELVGAFARREADPYTAAEEIVGRLPWKAATQSAGSLPALDHIGVGVRSLADAGGFYRALGLRESGAEEVEEQRVRVGFYPAGQARIELLESTDPGGPIGKFIEKKGPGLHHIALRVRDLRQTLADLDTLGFELIDRVPREGAGGHRIAFVHPRSTGGVLLELVEGGG